MRIYMYIYMYIYIYIYIYIRMCIDIHTHTYNIHISLYVLYNNVCPYAHVYTYICIYSFTIYVCTYIRIYKLCMGIYTHTQTMYVYIYAYKNYVYGYIYAYTHFFKAWAPDEIVGFKRVRYTSIYCEHSDLHTSHMHTHARIDTGFLYIQSLIHGQAIWLVTLEAPRFVASLYFGEWLVDSVG